MTNVEITSREAAVPSAAIQIQFHGRQVGLNWMTPGSSMAEALCGLPEVRSVHERIDPDRFTVFIILDRDPESVLDAVFDAEHRLYEEFRKMPFDVRVMKPQQSWSDKDLSASACLRYRRA